MRIPVPRTLAPVLAITCLGGRVPGADLSFRHHFIDRTLPVRDKQVGDYGLTALVDLDRAGDIDLCSKAWGPGPWNGNGGNMHVDFLENLLISGKAANK